MSSRPAPVHASMLIGGKPVNSNRLIEVFNPARPDELVGTVPRGTPDDVAAAIAAARKAQPAWAKLSFKERAAVLARALKKADENIPARAELFVRENGKTLTEAKGELAGVGKRMELTLELADELDHPREMDAPNGRTFIGHIPFGVVVSIVPWNAPVTLAVQQFLPALLAGNGVVLKPPESCPLGLIDYATAFASELPPGLLNIVTGLPTEIGDALTRSPGVDKIGFTGSTEVGKLMMVYAGQSNMKRVTTECGGKTPQIITGDVPDLDTAVQYAVNGIYGNQGEVCNAGSRLIVDAKIHDEFVSKFQEKAKKSFSPGDPLDPSTTMGPLVTKEQQKRVLSYIDIGKKEGAKLAMGGATPKGLDKGCYVSPTLFTGVKNDMRIAKEEIFGPVTGVLTYKKLDDAIAMANDSIYGLAASIWTSDVSTAHKAARDIEAGIVWVNCFDHGDMTSIWGGFKQSGMGRDKCLETLTTVTQTKSVWMHLG